MMSVTERDWNSQQVEDEPRAPQIRHANVRGGTEEGIKRTEPTSTRSEKRGYIAPFFVLATHAISEPLSSLILQDGIQALQSVIIGLRM